MICLNLVKKKYFDEEISLKNLNVIQLDSGFHVIFKHKFNTNQ